MSWFHSGRCPSVRLALYLSLVALTLPNMIGCSLGVMAGKMFFGDPKITSTFTERTHVDLTKEDKTLLVLCRTPYSVENELPSLEYDLNDGILRRLKQRGIKIVSPDKVAVWLDDNGGEVGNPTRLAKDFECDYIALVDVGSIRFYEENSRDMFRGYAHGMIRVYQVQANGADRMALQVYSGEFHTEYPQLSPISIHQMTERVFQKQFLDHLGVQIARHFHDYRQTETL